MTAAPITAERLRDVPAEAARARSGTLRVLHYNWVDPQDPARRGGGIRHYLAGLIAAQRQMPGLDVTTLSAGLSHDLLSAPPRWTRRRAGHFEIVNSAVLAPSHADFANPAQVRDPATEATFAAFLAATGPYDVIHFHTLEGLPAGVLPHAAQAAPAVLLSLHNYHPFCPQVNLWRQERAHCTDDAQGANCATCLELVPNRQVIRLAYSAETLAARLGIGPGTPAFDRYVHRMMRQGWRVLKWMRAHRWASVHRSPRLVRFRNHRAECVELLQSANVQLLAVSERTATLARQFGVTEVQTCYIGTDHAQHWARTRPRAWPANFSAERPLRLAYLGYMRRDKGFEFLMQALSRLPASLARAIHLTVAAARGAPDMMALMSRARLRLGGLDWVDGYDHASLEQLLADVDIGVVPSLWEDNLPQTALEMHARHIPLITSDRGGASELARRPEMTFPAGDRAALNALLGRLVSGALRLDRYWDAARAPASMPAHADALRAIYEDAMAQAPCTR